MSNEIICPECGAPNAPGSKFCNNCGSKLPLSTHIICPSCDTPNSRDRIFCDHCGSRLIPEEAPVPQEPEPETPPPAGKEAFSLPMREPGQTGDLDPSKVADLLKRAGAGEESKEDPPKLEDLIPKKKTTNELPDWLIVESDSEPIINAPTNISTEFFQDLLDRAEDLPSPDELMQDAVDANLPDWLTAGDKQAPPPAVTPTEPDEMILPDDIYSQLDADAAAAASPDDITIPEDIYADLEAAAPPAATESSDSWLDEVASETAAGSWLDDENDADAAAPEDSSEDPEGSGLTAWLGELETFSDAQKTPAEEDSFDPMDEFLADLRLPADDKKPETDSGWLQEASAVEEEIVVEPSSTPDLSWPVDTEMDPITGADEAGAAPADSGGLTDWLTDLTTLSDVEKPAGNDIDLGDLLSDTAEPTPAEELPDWLSELGPAQTSLLTDDQEGEEVADEETPDWMEALGPLQTDLLSDAAAEPAEEPVPEEESADLSWLDDADETFATLFEVEPSDEPLPDWLSDVAEEGSMYVGSGQTQELDEHINETLLSAADAATDDIDWLVQTGRLSTDELPDLFADSDMPIDLPADELGDAPIDEDADGLATGELPDWLSDLQDVQTGELELLEIAEEEATEETAVPSPTPEPAAPPVADASPPEEPSLQEEEMLRAEDVFFDSSTPIDSDMPDWLGELDAADAAEPGDDDKLILTEDLPDWIANMRPSEGLISSSLPGALNNQDDLPSGALEGIPADYAGADLPDWLQDAGIAADSQPVDILPMDEEIELEVPDWLQEDDAPFSDQQAIADSLSEQLASAAGEDWGAFIHDLPPADPLVEETPESEMPEWVLALKPVEQEAETAIAADTAAVNEMLPSSSPLLGLQQVIAIEPVISIPRETQPFAAVEAAPEHQQQAALLRQIMAQQTPSRKINPVNATPTLSMGLRGVLALLLLAFVVVGLQLPGNLVDMSRQPAPVHATAVDTALQTAAGKPVLVAVDYTPAFAGELQTTTELLIDELIKNGSPVILTSQQPAGTAIAQSLVADGITWGGYLPGEAMGLRQLGNCIATAEACTHIGGKPFSTELQNSLSDLGLIIVVTGDREILVNWIEQVGMPHQVSLVAGVTQALAPVAAPYFAAAQLSGYFGGYTDTAIYAHTYDIVPDDAVRQKMNAQLLAQVLMVLLLLAGMVTYGLLGRGKQTAEAPVLVVPEAPTDDAE